MFVTKKWLEERLESLKSWIRQWVKDYIDNERMCGRPCDSITISGTDTFGVAIASTDIGVTTEKKGEAKPECGCGGCQEWRKYRVWPARDWFSFNFDKENDGITPACWRHRIGKLEGQLAALLEGIGIEIVHMPQSTIPEHYEVVVPAKQGPKVDPRLGASKKRTKAR